MIKDKHTHPVVVGISGASGVILGIRTLEALHSLAIETHLIISPAACLTIEYETDYEVHDVLALADVAYKHADISAGPASGTFNSHIKKG